MINISIDYRDIDFFRGYHWGLNTWFHAFNVHADYEDCEGYFYVQRVRGWDKYTNVRLYPLPPL